MDGGRVGREMHMQAMALKRAVCAVIQPEEARHKLEVEDACTVVRVGVEA